MMNRLADYHVHTSRCGHAQGDMDTYVLQAISKNLLEIGFSDHAPAKEGFDPRHRTSIKEFPGYVNEIHQLRDQFPQFNIRLGIEMDLYSGFESDLEKLRTRFPIDYVIGSVHFIDEDALYFPDMESFTMKDKASSIKKYFIQIQKGACSGLVDVVGHFDLIKWAFPDAQESILDLGRKTLEIIAREGKILELNTSGLRKSINEVYPGPSLLSMAGDCDVPICLGSDAHKPEDVADHFSEALNLLGQAGYDTKVVWNDLLSVFRPLSP
jgi:histidinol-phosphatase (PHP family)